MGSCLQDLLLWRNGAPSRAFITATLRDVDAEQTLTRETIRRGVDYEIIGDVERLKYGPVVRVVAGPHADYRPSNDNVFTCIVYPPDDAQHIDEELPFFNVIVGAWGYVGLVVRPL